MANPNVPRTRTLFRYTPDTDVIDVPHETLVGEDARKTVAIPLQTMRNLIYGVEEVTEKFDLTGIAAEERARAAALALTADVSVPSWNKNLVRTLRKAVRARDGAGVLLRPRGRA